MKNVEGTTQLAAVLESDVFGYSRLVEADRAGTARMVAARFAVFDQIARQQGARVTNHSGGDSFLAVFTSAGSAVTAAIAIQRRFQQLNKEESEDPPIHCRMGVEIGDVYMKGEAVTGTAVNTAARIEKNVASPGSVCISATVLAQVRGQLTLPVEDLGEQPLKNIEASIHVYQLSVYRPEGEAHGSAPARSTRRPYVPKFASAPTDQDKAEFIREAFQTVRHHFEIGLKQLETVNPNVHGDFEPIDARRFVARVFVNGDQKGVATVWLAAQFGGAPQIYYSSQDHGSGEANSWNESLHVDASDGELVLVAMAMSFGMVTQPFDLKNLTAEDGADYLWRMFVERMDR